MGSFRFILSILVIYSHTGRGMFGINPGVWAVVSFFIISGYVITKLINKNYPDLNSVGGFYFDRFLRIYPQLIFYILLTSAYYLIFTKETFITPINVILNSMGLPLNFLISTPEKRLIVSQSWSIALELQFYLLLPFIVFYKKRATALYLSLFAFTLAYAGVMNTDFYGYRMISGTLFIFMIGSYMADSGRVSKHVLIPYFSCIIMLCVARHLGVYKLQYNAEVLWGVVIGVPIVWVLHKFRSKGFDMFLGNISYSLYLCHKLVQYCLFEAGINYRSEGGLILTIAISSVVAFASYKLIEVPFYNYRHKYRERNFSPAEST